MPSTSLGLLDDGSGQYLLLNAKMPFNIVFASGAGGLAVGSLNVFETPLRVRFLTRVNAITLWLFIRLGIVSFHFWHQVVSWDAET